MVLVRQTDKPRRWDRPFADVPLPARDVGAVLALPMFQDIDRNGFPDDLRLADIVANDARIVTAGRGDVVYRQGTYGTSVFMVLTGSVQSMIDPDGGHRQDMPPRAPSLLRSLSRKWHRGIAIMRGRPATPAEAQPPPPALPPDGGELDPLVLTLGRHEMFGVVGALTRNPRSASVVASEDDTRLLEVRWPGIRELLQWSEPFRAQFDELYREWGFWNCLLGCPLFRNADEDALKLIAESSHFERYGDFEWTRQFQKHLTGDADRIDMIGHEPVIAEQDHYLDGLLLIHSGCARLTEKHGREECTVGYVAKNDVIGLSEIADGLEAGGDLHFPNSLRAVGYVDLVRIPTRIVEAYLLPSLPDRNEPKQRSEIVSAPPGATTLPRGFTEFFIDNRFTNGARAMVVNTDRCVDCDDCVRACAAAHDGVPRFVRRGAMHRNLMIANACMHCADPVCLIDCPTGAIHRQAATGTVVIDGASCIGCGACADACPYDNILMAELRDPAGAFLTDQSGAHILRAEKCDLCTSLDAGPACARACPHDALLRVDIRDPGTLLDWLDPAP